MTTSNCEDTHQYYLLQDVVIKNFEGEAKLFKEILQPYT